MKEFSEPEEESSSSELEELYEHHRIVADKGQEPLRVDKFLINRLPNTSRNRLQNAVEAGSVLVNGREVKSSYKVKPGDLVTVVLAHPPRDIELYPDDIPLQIVYEDDSLIVIDKAAGMVVHPAYGHYRGTLVNALVHHFHPYLGEKPLQSESLRPGLVHRIDKNTSGLVVVAKTEMAMTHLARQFYERTIRRRYLALVWGEPKEKEGSVDVPLGRSLADRKLIQAFPDGSQGKHAVTHYKVLESLGYVSLLECRLETGRTHQIRVHMKYIGHTLFSDDTYGGDKILKGTHFSRYRQFVENCFSIMPRQALHARSLGFEHPETRQAMYFESDLPDDFQQVLEKWRMYSGAAGSEQNDSAE